MLRAYTLKKETVSGRIAVSCLRFLHHLRKTGKERTVTATILGIQPSMAHIPVDLFSWEALKSKTTYIVVTGQAGSHNNTIEGAKSTSHMGTAFPLQWMVNNRSKVRVETWRFIHGVIQSSYIVLPG